jgi:hypothetical protein
MMAPVPAPAAPPINAPVPAALSHPANPPSRLSPIVALSIFCFRVIMVYSPVESPKGVCLTKIQPAALPD